MAGQGTMGLEIPDQLADVETILLAIGGGELIASLLHGGLEWRVGALRRYPSCDADEFGLPELAHSVERFDRDGNLGHTSGVVA